MWQKMLLLNQTYLPVITYHSYLLKTFATDLSKLCPPRHLTATFIFRIENECDSMSPAPKSNLDLANCLTFLTALQESQHSPFIVTWNSIYAHPLYCIHSSLLVSSKSFNPLLLLPSHQLPRVVIWSIKLASAAKSHHFWPSASSETGLNLLVNMFRIIFSTSD